MLSIVKTKYWLLVLALVMFGAFPGKGMAISITNPSFETSVAFNNSAAQGNWVFSVLSWSSGSAGTFEPSTPGNSFGTDVFSVNVPDGSNTAFSNGAEISQVLSDVLTVGTTYNLRVWVGDRLDTTLPSHSIQLFAGAQDLGSASASPADGTFAEASLTYLAKIGDLGIGSPLEIVLNNFGGVQVNWDNVRLTATTDPIPEPATVALLGIGLAGLVGVGIRRKWKKEAEVKS